MARFVGRLVVTAREVRARNAQRHLAAELGAFLGVAVRTASATVNGRFRPNRPEPPRASRRARKAAQRAFARAGLRLAIVP
jgi:hypothetical protein